VCGKKAVHSAGLPERQETREKKREGGREAAKRKAGREEREEERSSGCRKGRRATQMCTAAYRSHTDARARTYVLTHTDRGMRSRCDEHAEHRRHARLPNRAAAGERVTRATRTLRAFLSARRRRRAANAVERLIFIRVLESANRSALVRRGEMSHLALPRETRGLRTRRTSAFWSVDEADRSISCVTWKCNFAFSERAGRLARMLARMRR